MQSSALLCPVFEDIALVDADFDRSTDGLARDTQGEAPFMLSYGIRLHNQEVACDLDCRAWQIQNGKLRSHVLDADRPELARQVAPQFFTFLHFYALHDACGDVLHQFIPQADNQTYHCCISPHGVILVASDIRAACSNRGEKAGFAGLIPTDLSNHQVLSRLAGLQDCANALLLHQRSLGSHERYKAVKVARA